MEILKFIRNPQEKLSKDKTIYQTLWKVVLLFILCFGSSVISLLITETLRNLEFIPEYTRELGSDVNRIRNNTVFATIVFPIIEELAFRLYLKRNNLNVFISSLFMTYMIASAFVFNTSHFSLEKYGILRIFISLSTALLVLFVYQKRIFSLNFKWLYYLSALLFGLVHIYNYDYTNPKVLIFAIIICMPQILSGLFFGYARIKYGIIGAIILHGLLNGLPTLIL
ncbi:MAG: CPBP family glutamic-type intramembrane protease [Bacteroidota bacterium]